MILRYLGFAVGCRHASAKIATQLWTVLLVACPVHGQEKDKVDFAKDVAPIFEQHCVRCHIPGIEKGDVSLATFEDLHTNEYVISGDAESSYLLELVDGDSPEMPKDSEPLSRDEVAVIRRWIDSGAGWPKDVVLREKSKADRTWWSLQPLDAGQSSYTHSIDDFVRARLAEENIAMNPPADRRSLIRRATYDLIGLPPTPEEVEAFVSDDSPDAFESLVDRLLNSPHYGERWGRHWLDVVRFGESSGFEQNFLINELWPFRDYVIRSINADKPFDQLIREHIAGDIIGKDQPDVSIGSAFLVAGPYDSVGNQDAVQAAQIRANTLDEMIRATSEAFLGITVGCARCHDHKFDPITQEDYYRMYATFSGIRHGSTTLATSQQRRDRNEALATLNRRKSEIEQTVQEIDESVLARALKKIDEFEASWTRPAVDRTGTEEIIQPTPAKFVRLLCDGTDSNPNGKTFKLDEFEIWSAGENSQNVALATSGAVATGKARINEDFPGVYGPHLAIDGKAGERFLSASNEITIELPEPAEVHRFVFSNARGEANPQQRIFDSFPAEYRIEVSLDGDSWTQVASGSTRKCVNETHRDHRLLKAEITPSESKEKRQLRSELTKVNVDIAKVPKLPKLFVGIRNADDAKGPFNVFIGGSPQRRGAPVVPASLSTLRQVTPSYELPSDSDEAARRGALADWVTSSDNPLTARVLANRLWHYHFGTGIVDTPSDLGYMGGRPTHPRLLDFLAIKLIENGYQIKAMHRLIMLSDTYRQSSAHREEAAKIDGDSRLLWRFPPRRLSAEEVRDTILQITGKFSRHDQKDASVLDGGPGFRLYRFMRDNVSTYTPLDKHDATTYRRAVYHQNARASVVDLMTDFDQPDCSFSAPKRAETTTPLQALTMLNHSFTLDMAAALADRLSVDAGDDPRRQVHRAYELCYSRQPTDGEVAACREFMREHGVRALCRVLLNTSELIYLGPPMQNSRTE
ncbi:MAG: PSD1 and planctomycete cytochrome C domain-containing protein [Aureliella sp.]